MQMFRPTLIQSTIANLGVNIKKELASIDSLKSTIAVKVASSAKEKEIIEDNYGSNKTSSYADEQLP